MSNKAAGGDSLVARLSRANEITITVTGRTSGRDISVPAWFVFEDPTLYLLPVYGSDTQWYNNVLENPSIQVKVRGAETEVRAVPFTDPKHVSSVIERFREKHGAGDVKKYYSKFDVAVLAHLK